MMPLERLYDTVFLVHGISVTGVQLARTMRDVVTVALDEADPVPLRAPHSSCSERGLIQEVALAAGGVLYLDEVPDFRPGSLLHLVQTWRGMWQPVRPILVMSYTPVGDPHDVAFRRQLTEAQEKMLKSVRFLFTGQAAVASFVEGNAKDIARDFGLLDKLVS